MKKTLYLILLGLALAGTSACVREATDENDDAQEKATKEQADKEPDHSMESPESR